MPCSSPPARLYGINLINYAVSAESSAKYGSPQHLDIDLIYQAYRQRNDGAVNRRHRQAVERGRSNPKEPWNNR
jgi:hypothetical protein